eukprot:807141-Pelagomonas_calceolata.AAC.1
MEIRRVACCSPSLILVMRVERSLLKSTSGASEFISVLDTASMNLQSKLDGCMSVKTKLFHKLHRKRCSHELRICNKCNWHTVQDEEQIILDCPSQDLTNFRAQLQHLFSSASPSSATRLKDFVNQADVLGHISASAKLHPQAALAACCSGQAPKYIPKAACSIY